MGPRLSLLAPSAPTVALSSYIDVLRDFQYQETMSNSRFLKTIKASEGNHAVVIKMLIKPTGHTIALDSMAELVARQCQILAHLPNCAPWQRMIETDRAAYLVRPMLKANLYDRLSLRPFFEAEEKLFVVYQMLRAVADIHELDVVHGDLKLENFMVTSWNWVVLVDFASLLKPAYIPEDNPNQFSFYFDTSDRRLCYLAPERFYNSKKTVRQDTFSETGEYTRLLDSKCDMFSLGCAIAELYSDGEPTFTLSQSFKYMKGEFTPDLSSIPEPLRQLVRELLAIDASERPSAQECLDRYTGTCFPNYTFLYDFVRNLSQGTPDEKMERIYKEGKRKGERKDGRREDDGGEEREEREEKEDGGGRENGNAFFLKLKLRRDLLYKESLIILSVVFSHIKNLRTVTGKLQAIELVVALSSHVSDGSKLDRSLPYLCLFIDEYVDAARSGGSASCKVVCFAMRAITAVLSTVSHISPINVHVFSEYLFPKLTGLFGLNVPVYDKEMVKMTLAMCVPHLAAISKRFCADFDEAVEKIAFSLLTDAQAAVKSTLCEHILPLCEYLGVERTNDLVLPHLITYLNDSDSQLRLAFLRAVLVVGPFVGVLSFEQYVMPLLLQALGDAEQLVVVRVLEIFTQFVSSRVMHAHWNAMAIYSTLLEHSVILLLHPNAWIRQSVMSVILAVSDTLGAADRYCFLYPHIKSFLTYDLVSLSWDTLYPCVTSPVSRAVYDLTVAWCVHATSKSLFWQKKSSMPQTGKSVYLPKSKVTLRLADGNRSSVPLSPEDKSWLIKLKSVGLSDRDLWKVFVLRDYVISVSRGTATVSVAEYNMAAAFNVPVHSVYFDVHYKSESLAVSTVESEADGSLTDSKSLVFPSRKSRVSTQTVQANVFGELDMGHKIEGPNSTRVFSVNSSIVIAATKHSYTGTNPHILRYLSTVHLEPTLDDFPEFGEKEQRRDTEAGIFKTPSLIVKVDTNFGEIDGINCLAVGASSEFFITGSESGLVKIWDTHKMEKAASVKNASVSVSLGAAVKAIEILPQRHCFAVATADGKVRVYRIDTTRSKGRRFKSISMHMVREHGLRGEYVVQMHIEGRFICGITSAARLVGIDMVGMSQAWSLQNPPAHGNLTTFIVGDKMSWMLVGTSEGMVCLWDLRFKALLRTWRVDNRPGPIVKLVSLGSRFAMIGPSSDISIWDIPSFTCTKVFQSQEGLEHPYKLVEARDLDVVAILDSLAISGTSLLEDGSRQCYSAMVAAYGYLVSATADKRLVLWNVERPEASVALNRSTRFVTRALSATAMVEEKGGNGREIQDTVTCVGFLTWPRWMVVAADRSGCVYLFA